ncbi:hypothetical protein JCM8202v2_000291 [Rhodotorula sphaerocarpa]
MSLKHELEVWVAALAAFDARDYETALERFEEVAHYSKVLFNMAMIHAIRGQHGRAIADFARAISLDPFFAVAHFQLGVSAFLLGQYKEARKSFDRCLKLFSCEVRFNRGLSLIYGGESDRGMQDLVAAQADKQSSEHDVIDEAIADKARGYTVFSVPVGVAFRPPPQKVDNLEQRDYLGKAKVIAATEPANLFTGFAGTEKRAREAAHAVSDPPRRKPNRSFTTTGRLQKPEKRSDTQDGPTDQEEASLRRSHTNPAARSSPPTASPGKPKQSSEIANPSREEEVESGAGTVPAAAPSGSEASKPNPSVGRIRANTAPTTSRRTLKRAQSLAKSDRTPSRSAAPSGPLRPITRPPPLDLQLLHAPLSPGHRRSASSPALLSPASASLPYDKADVVPQESMPPTVSGAPAPSETAAPSQLVSAEKERIPTAASSEEGYEGLASAFAALSTRYPPLVRAASQADAGRPALTRSRSRFPSEDDQTGNPVDVDQAPIVASPQSGGTTFRGDLYDQYANELLQQLNVPKLRAKLAIEATTTLVELYNRVRKKLDLVADFLLAFREADGSRVVLKDEEDWQCALEAAQDMPLVGVARLVLEVAQA